MARAEWEQCANGGCGGAALDETGRCLAHLEPEERSRYLRDANDRIDARGVRIDTPLLDEMLASLPVEDGRRRFGRVGFQSATFLDDARFDRAIFERDAQFTEARFEKTAQFRGAEFGGDASFDGATFVEEAYFGGSRFRKAARFSRAISERRARFDHARFQEPAAFARAEFRGKIGESDADLEGGVSFDEAVFDAKADFDHARFSGRQWFFRAQFRDDAWFTEATFTGHTWFGAAVFERMAGFAQTRFEGNSVFNFVGFLGETLFRAASFKGEASFAESTFTGRTIFDQATFVGTLWLASTSCSGPLRLELSVGTLRCDGAQFLGGAHLRVRRGSPPAAIVLDEAEFGRMSIVAGAAGFTELQESERAKLLDVDPATEVVDQPRVVSLQRADVTNLVLADVDLRCCRFTGAHNLDRLRLEEGCRFAKSPPGRRWTRRQAIAEEHEWRSGTGNPGGWYAHECRPPDWLQTEPIAPVRIRSIYRALRKAREDSRDEPGAADFYYGEMEMRRNDRSSSRAERVILTLYWALSGYSLRASRAFAALLVAVVVFAAAFRLWGFTADESYGDALLFSLGSAVRVASAREHPLNGTGDALHIVLGVVGPVLVGLALLAIRGRVKR